ncbi:hypothetical protein GC101_15870 [Paenibacillus sp. LMG 31459]|uniref:Uncharacterized protein n=2 Tax=Paenibacillus phytohabitans TaxID=2654978 RepID=A0ABX1YKE6_9BACL|nr:hypothetical protein [Paenibacillus phytohabitans]
MNNDGSLFEADDVPSVGWRGYRPRGGSYNREYISLNEAWNDRGLFLFAGSPPDPDALLTAVKQYEQYLRDHEDRDSEEIQLIWLNTTPLNNCKILKIVPGAGGWKTKNNFEVSLENTYSLSIPKPAFVEFQAERMQLAIKKTDKPYLRFMDEDYTAIDDLIVYLPFGGKDGGAFRFRIQTPSNRVFEENVQFNVGLKYFYKQQIGHTTANKERNYPIFEKEDGKKLHFLVSLDELDPFNRHYETQPDLGLRSYLVFDPSVDALPSHFRTPFGHTIELQPDARLEPNVEGVLPRPLPGSGMLVLSPKYKISAFDPAYTVPQGNFYLSVTDTEPFAGAMRLLCGGTGTETIVFVPQGNGYRGDRMEFIRGKPAFWPADPLGSETDQPPPLKDDAYTSWIAVRPSDNRIFEAPPITYSAQPEDDPHFRPVAEGVSHFHEPVIFDWTRDTDNSIPLVPLLGVQRNDKSQLKQALAMERRGIAPNRKQLMNQLSAGSALGSTAFTDGLSTTPQGLFVQEIAGQWSELIIGQNIRNAAGLVPGAAEAWDMLKFTKPSAVFRNALLSNRLFLVVSMNSTSSPLWETFDDLVTISGWPFKLAVPGDMNYQNILIFKFCPGSLLEGIEQPGRWTDGEAFNQAGQLGMLSTWLSNYCMRGVAEKDVPPELIPFYRMCRDPKWNGIVALNVDIIPEQMPDDLICLIGGIKPGGLRAHHVGLDSSLVEWDAAAGLKLDKPSSLFGYVKYEDLDNVNWDSYTYKFRVTELKARFVNTKIELFHAKIELLVRTLYGSPVKVSEEGGPEFPQPILTLYGSMEQHEGVPAYVFQTKTPVHAAFQQLVLPPILQNMRLDKISFQTLDASDKQNIKTGFSIYGSKIFLDKLNPEVDQVIDLFGYGVKAGLLGLLFGNLGITMNFDINDPVNSGKFAFDISQVSLDPEKSSGRPGSLGANFPLRLRYLVSAESVADWNKLGYRNVPIAGLPEYSAANGPWYGLVFDFEMGTLGKLLPEGMLVGNLIAGWNADGKFYCGLKIPGLDVDKEKGLLALEEMLDLKLPNDLQLALTSDGYLMSTQAVVRLFGTSYKTQFTIFQADHQKGQIGWYLTTNGV